MKTPFSLSLAAISVLSLAPFTHGASVKLEAESGSLGASFVSTNISGVQSITIIGTAAGNNPGASSRVASYSVTFPEAGTYDLFARVRVGASTASDDSLFYANGLGSKSPTADADWILMNNLATSGYTAAGNVVTNNGTAGSQVWKWVNLSEFSAGGEAPVTFIVTPGNLTQTFQIGGREDGLAIDALMFGTANYTFTVAELDAGGPGTPPSPPPVPAVGDLVHGDLIQFNDNGTWSWYMDERAIIDVAGGKLIAGSDASAAGTGGSSRNGAVEAVIFDLATGAIQRTALLPAGGGLGADDHNAPAFMLRPDGKYLAQWTGHNDNWLSYFRIYDGNSWGPTNYFDWTTVGAVSGEQASYSNPHYLAAEGRAYTFVRSMDNRSPHILMSTNYGDTWSFYGKLVRPSTNFTVGYNPGYFRYSDNGVDRIDFICTEAHPRDYSTSMYHGYISNNMSFKSDGTVVDSNLNDTNCLFSYSFTPVFLTGTVSPPGQTNYRAWNDDVNRYPDGSVECIISTRINDNTQQGYPDDEIDPNHAFFFCRYDGSNWTSTYLCQAGTKMYSSEGDYVGLGCLDPDDADTIYISTRFDPRAVQPGVADTNQPFSTMREIWKGVTTNHGAGFTWTPVTEKSVRDNFRPIIPKWNPGNTALLWFRGTYSTAQIFDAAIVGLIQRNESVSAMTFVDATSSNTTFTNGSPLTTTGPDANAGADDNQWHSRTGVGNGGSVLTSSEVGDGEDAPTLKTQVTFPESGTYDVWVNFWANPLSDWRVRAGLSAVNVQVFRSMSSQQVEPGRHSVSITLSNTGGTFLYQAYLGRVTGASCDVYVDDFAIQTGTVSTSTGDTARTWYDGVSFARINPPAGLPYDIWIAGFGLSGTNALPGSDYDADGFVNAVEFLLGGNPTSNDSALIKPTYSLNASEFVYEYRRTDVSNVPQGYVGDVYYSTDLLSWTKAVNGVNGVTISSQNDFYGAGVDKVTVQLPNAIATGGNLFVRLGVSFNP